ncbi:MAG: SRPBCC family protein [Pyrinomonadaceae bacterium]
MSTEVRGNGNGYAQDSGGGGEWQGALASAFENVDAEKLARGLGWFSIGLGLAEVFAPGGIAKISGVSRKSEGLIRLLGLREIAHGVGIFSQGRRPTEAVWARVVGDALDLACMGAAFASPETKKGRLAFATANVLAVAALDVLCAQQLSSGEGSSDAKEGGTTQVKNSLIINRAPEELYQYWHDFENLPNIMKHLESVRVRDERRSHWVAKAPAGTSVEWDAEITEDRPNELIAWRSLEGSQVENSGSVRFEPAPGNRGTIVRVEIDYTPPGGALGSLVAKLFGEEPGQQAQESLRSFKQLMETGEVTISDGTFWDNGILTQRPAQPVSGEEAKQLSSKASA